MFYPVCHMAPELYNPGQIAVQGLSAMVQSGASMEKPPVNLGAFFRLGRAAQNGCKTSSIHCCLSISNNVSLHVLCMFCLTRLKRIGNQYMVDLNSSWAQVRKLLLLVASKNDNFCYLPGHRLWDF